MSACHPDTGHHSWDLAPAVAAEEGTQVEITCTCRALVANGHREGNTWVIDTDVKGLRYTIDLPWGTADLPGGAAQP